MTRAVIKIDKKGVEQLLRSPEVEADIKARAQRIASAAGAGHSVTTFQGTDRVRAHVATDTPEAMEAEATERRLSNAIDAGRGL